MQDFLSRHSFQAYGAMGGRSAWRGVSPAERTRRMKARAEKGWKTRRAKKISSAANGRKSSARAARAMVNVVKQ